MGKETNETKKCSNVAIAFTLFLSIFLFGAVLGLILFLTDGGGTSTSNTPEKPIATFQSQGICEEGKWGSNCTVCSPCGLHGACNGSGTTSGTGTCLCGIGYASTDCSSCATGYWGATCTKCGACSGHGSCDGSGTSSGTGACVCAATDTTSFDGTNCEKCAPGFFGNDCTKCEVSCGIHGKCSDGIAGDGTCGCDLGWKGDTCAACDINVAWTGTTGNDCFLSPGLTPGEGGIIVLGTFKKCNDHGTLTLATGVCTCKSGWSGVGCSVAMCASSDEYGALCESCSCNGNGICDGAGTKTGTGQCRCNVNYRGATCTACRRGFTGSNCNTACPTNNGLVCSGSGECNDNGKMVSNPQSGDCICDQGYSGDKCETGSGVVDCVTDTSTNEICNDHGTCETNTCKCAAGYDIDTKCGSLLSGWAKIGGVVAECPGSAATPCNNKGACSSTTGECSCNDEYTGTTCSECAYGYWRAADGTTCTICPATTVINGITKVCTNNHGTCGSDGKCTCLSGWKGENCDSCALGFWGASCWSCPRSKNTADACSGHGSCDGSGTIGGTGACTCLNANYIGSACGTCKAGHYGGNCVACLKDMNGDICSGRGSCDGDGTIHGDGTCRCLAGSTGALCELCLNNHYGSSCVKCPGMMSDGSACNGHGTCNGQGTRQGAGTCTCVSGWGGLTCAEPKPCSALNNCNGHGTCSDASEGICFCDLNYQGEECLIEKTLIEQELSCGVCNRLDEKCISGICSNVAPPSDPCGTEDCSRHGMCTASNCICDPSWTGTKCNVDRGLTHQWDATDWTICSDDCGETGERERKVQCVGGTNNARAADSICTTAFGPAPDSFEPCHRFTCGSVVSVGGIILNMEHKYVNTSSLHVSTFENAVEIELSTASNVPASRFHVVTSSSGGTNNIYTLIKFVVLPPTKMNGDDKESETISSDLKIQSLNSESKLRTQGTFIRRIVPHDGALNFVSVTAQARPAASADGTASKSMIEEVDPFMDVSAGGNYSPSGSSSNTGLNHGGLTGIIVATSFLGLGALVGLIWFGMHRTSAGSAYKAGSAAKKSTMKIQLTEAEKSEMGMVNNPNLTNKKTNEAIAIVQQAVLQDEARKYPEAIQLYESAVNKFKEIMRIEKNSQYKFSLAKKMDKYMTRIKELKQHLKKGGVLSKPPRPSSMPRNGNGGGKSKGLVRAPQVVKRQSTSRFSKTDI